MERSKQGGQLMGDLEDTHNKSQIDFLQKENGKLKNLLRETYSLSCIDEIIMDHQNKEEGFENIEPITDLKKKIDGILMRGKNNGNS